MTAWFVGSTSRNLPNNRIIDSTSPKFQSRSNSPIQVNSSPLAMLLNVVSVQGSNFAERQLRERPAAAQNAGKALQVLPISQQSSIACARSTRRSRPNGRPWP